MAEVSPPPRESGCGRIALRKGLQPANPGRASTESSLQAISFYFQFLNLAEEHVANSMRTRRERENPDYHETGHWGHYFQSVSPGRGGPLWR
jgi:hypothetical protein